MFLFVCILSFVSCEQEDVWSELQVEGDVNESPLTRSANGVPAAIDQLNGIPVNIKSMINNKYLSAEAKGTSIYLAASDDGSLRQRWNIELKHNNIWHAYINLIGGNSTYPNGELVVYTDRRVALDKKLGIISNINVVPSGDGVTYNILTIGEVINNPPSFPVTIPYYIQPNSASSTSVTAAKGDNKGDQIGRAHV